MYYIDVSNVIYDHFEQHKNVVHGNGGVLFEFYRYIDHIMDWEDRTITRTKSSYYFYLHCYNSNILITSNISGSYSDAYISEHMMTEFLKIARSD